MDCNRKWLVDFNTGKTQLFSFYWSNNTGAIDVKMDGSVSREKSSFNMLELTFSSKVDSGSCIVSIAKTAYKKIGALLHSMKFLLPCGHAWNNVGMSGMMLLVQTQNR